MPNRDDTGRLGRGRNCDETTRADKMYGQERPRDRRDRGCGLWSW